MNQSNTVSPAFQSGETLMTTIANSITVNVPVNRAYNQWTQFEEFPVSMEGVKEVKQLDAKRLRGVIHDQDVQETQSVR
jgi:uncharacterized membrane protein